MLSAKLFSFCALVASAAAQTYTYEFNPASAGGVKGAIQVQYAGADSSKATVSADLDFSGVDLAAITKADGNCTAEVTEYKWHIHVKWGSNKTSDSYGQCSKALAGNHYDPLKACGPNSEFAEAPECLPKIKSYACNPGNYTKNPEVCEKGDLSGKFGAFKLDGAKRVKGSWVDEHYPLPKENTPQWNMILHASCGGAPRVACALAKEQQSPTPCPTTTGAPTPCPSATASGTPCPSSKPVTPAPSKPQC